MQAKILQHTDFNGGRHSVSDLIGLGYHGDALSRQLDAMDRDCPMCHYLNDKIAGYARSTRYDG